MNPKIPRKNFADTVEMKKATESDFEDAVDRIQNDILFSGEPKEPMDEKDAFERLEEEKLSETSTEARDPNAPPSWATIPPDLVFPNTTGICFMLFRKEWTRKPGIGDRNIILWPLSFAEESAALNRAPPDAKAQTLLNYLALSCIRSIDGKKAVWHGVDKPHLQHGILRFADEIGAKCMNVLRTYYHKEHSMTDLEYTDFLVNCFDFKSGQHVENSTTPPRTK
jgi:hypothetical protein